MAKECLNLYNQYERASGNHALVPKPAINTSSQSPKEILSHALSGKPVVFTSSAERMNDTRSGESQQFVCIDHGFCGTIWNPPGTEIAF